MFLNVLSRKRDGGDSATAEHTGGREARRLRWWSVSFICAGICLMAATGGANAYDASLTRTTGGVANIKASTLPSAAFGSGYAQAEDGICTLAERYMTVSGERARYLGPGSGNANLNQDFYWASLIEDETIEELIAKPYPEGASNTAKRMVEGFAAGYNKYLSDVGGPDGITDPRCSGEDWVHPIEGIDVWLRMLQTAMLQGTNPRVSLLGSAQPPGGSAPAVAPAGEPDIPGDRLGSNALAIGRDNSATEGGLILGNPHYPWSGSERFWESHVTVPGKYHAMGAALWGMPGPILIGHNQNVGWSHTVATNTTVTQWRLQLAPGNPTSYMVDGQPVPMTHTDVTVKSLEGGTLVDRSRRLYSSRYGPIMSSPAWTTSTATALLDANASNVRTVDQWLTMGQAETAEEMVESLRTHQASPFINTIGADSKGTAFYLDWVVTPNLPNSYLDGSCNLNPGKSPSGPFDGSIGSCRLANHPDAAAPGILPASQQPKLVRHDYVGNANDSYWLANQNAPLAGYSRANGGEVQNPGLRAQTGHDMVNQRMGTYNGGVPTDGLGTPQGFDLESLRESWTKYRSLAAERTLPGLRQVCHEIVDNAGGMVGGTDISEACPILDDYGATAGLEDEGGWLFNRWLASTSGNIYVNPWSAANPVNTPNTLDTSLPTVKNALAAAVNDLRNRSIPLDAGFGDVQYAAKSTQIPIPGCGGCYSSISSSYDGPGMPKSRVNNGSSWVMFAEMNPEGPRAQGLLTYSQSEDVTSPFYDDQTQRFSDDAWIDLPWTDEDVEEDKLGPTAVISDLSNEHVISVTKSGTGSGMVTSDAAGIACGEDCSNAYELGETIIFKAEPATGSTFTGWSGGGCSGIDACEVTVQGAATVTAGFAVIPSAKRTLTVTKGGSGSGSVASSSGGLACGSNCAVEFDEGSEVTLNASPEKGSNFAGWYGAGCSGTGTCQVALGNDREVIALFDKGDEPIKRPALRITRISPKAGAIRAGKAATIKVAIRNSGEAVAQKVKVCASVPPKNRKTVKSPGCKSLGSIVAGATRTVSLKLKTTGKAKGTVKVSLKVTSTAPGSLNAGAKLKIRKE